MAFSISSLLQPPSPALSKSEHEDDKVSSPPINCSTPLQGRDSPTSSAECSSRSSQQASPPSAGSSSTPSKPSLSGAGAAPWFLGLAAAHQLSQLSQHMPPLFGEALASGQAGPTAQQAVAAAAAMQLGLPPSVWDPSGTASSMPPWFYPYTPKASSHKRKGGQIRFTNEQTDSLEQTFDAKKYLAPQDRKKLAKHLSLTERQVKTWFQNRRAKWRRIRKDGEDEDDLPPNARSHFEQQAVFGKFFDDK